MISLYFIKTINMIKAFIIKLLDISVQKFDIIKIAISVHFFCFIHVLSCIARVIKFAGNLTFTYKISCMLIIIYI